MNIAFLQKFHPLAFSFLLFSGFAALAQQTQQQPRFDEVYKLLQEHAIGLNGDELNNAAVRGLLDELQPRVSIVTNGASASAASSTNIVAKAELFERFFPYLRVGRVEAGLAEQLPQQLQKLAGTNKIKGLVLDLRFAGGDDFAAAAKVADQFLNSEQPLLDWGKGGTSATKKTNSVTVPVAVLVNRETRGAAEALAAVLRETKVGLLLGAPTAGEASVYKDFPLQTGQRVRIATAKIKVGGKEMLAEPLKPDIEVNVNRDDERLYMEDPYQQISPSLAQVEMTLGTNAVTVAETNRPRSRINEAELVRRKREGLSTEEEFTEAAAVRADSEIRLIRDPALARAVDLLKGLSVIRPNRQF